MNLNVLFSDLKINLNSLFRSDTFKMDLGYDIMDLIMEYIENTFLYLSESSKWMTTDIYYLYSLRESLPGPLSETY